MARPQKICLLVVNSRYLTSTINPTIIFIIFNQTIHIFTRNLHQKWVTSTNFCWHKSDIHPMLKFSMFLLVEPPFLLLSYYGFGLGGWISIWISSSNHAAKSRLCWNMRIITRCHNSIPISTITDLYSWLNYAKKNIIFMVTSPSIEKKFTNFHNQMMFRHAKSLFFQSSMTRFPKQLTTFHVMRNC